MSTFQSASLSIAPPLIHSNLLIGTHLFENQEFLNKFPTSRRYAILVAEPVMSYGQALQRHLGLETKIMVLSDGEFLKTRNGKEKVENFLLENGYGRESSLIVIGGGAALDLGGYVAATYCRGIPYYSVPTTLLAMTDAAIGGKTGINVPQAKNFLGAYHHPIQILINLDILESLPPEEFFNGFSETIKHALIADEKLFSFLESQLPAICEMQMDVLEKMIWASCLVKKNIVEIDPFEQLGIRSLLNFGHTVGHALETLSQYSLKHGFAVLVGMRIEAWMSMERGDLNASSYARIMNFLDKVPFPEFSLPSFSLEELYSIVRLDKKTKSDLPYFVSLQNIGQAHVVPLEKKLLWYGVKHALRGHQDAFL